MRPIRSGRLLRVPSIEVRDPKRSRDEIADLEAEFAQSWSLEAPAELREVLDPDWRSSMLLCFWGVPSRESTLEAQEQVLFPEIVAAREERESRQPIARL